LLTDLRRRAPLGFILHVTMSTWATAKIRP